MDHRGFSKLLAPALLVLAGALAAPPAPAMDSAPNEGGWLGVYIQDLNASLRKHFAAAPAEGGVLISSVMRGSPAQQAGLRSGDILLELDATPLQSAEHLRQLVSKTRPDTEVQLRVLREAQTIELTARLGSKPAGGVGSGRLGSRLGTRQIPWNRWFILGHEGGLGARMADLNAGLSEYIEGTDGTGVLVLEVCEDSPADQAGLRPGDVIVAANGQSVVDLGDLRHELRRSGGESAGLEFVRKGVRSTATIELRTGPECWKDPGRSFFRVQPDAPSPWLEPEAAPEDRSALERWFRAVPDSLAEVWRFKAEARAEDQLRDQVRELRSIVDGLGKEIQQLRESLAAKDLSPGQ
jgi:membrane-associated protease RseP (regulator of RpoE activity)